MNRIEMDELLVALDKIGERTNGARAAAYLAAIPPMSLDGSKDRSEALLDAVQAAHDRGVKDLKPYTYPDIAAFEADYEPMESLAVAAMAYAGMGQHYSTHHLSLRQMIDSITREAQHDMRLDPARNWLAAAYTDLALAVFGIRTAVQDNEKLLDKIRGPWAAKLFDHLGADGELTRYPHMALDRLQTFAEYSTGYRAARTPTPARRVVTRPSASPPDPEI